MALFEGAPEAPRSGGTLHVGFAVDRANFGAARETLEARGLPPRFADHGLCHSLYITDPDGYQIEITTSDVSRGEVPTADFKLFIDGEFCDAASGETFESIDPSSGQAIGTVAKAGRDDAARAIDAARAAFDDGRWSARPRPRGPGQDVRAGRGFVD